MLLSFRGFRASIFIPAIANSLSGVSQAGNDPTARDCAGYLLGRGDVPDQPMGEVLKKRVSYVLQGDCQRFGGRR